MAHRDEPTQTSGPTADPAYEETARSPDQTPTTGLGPGGGRALVAGARIGRFEIVDVIGSGGMGVVYQARDPDLDRELAIKVVQPSVAGARAQQRLVEEARAMAKLRHPSVMPVFDVGTFEGGVYVVMPLVTGGTMHDWLIAKPQPWRAVVERFLAAGRGLAAAHAAGLIHRDFKPRNVILGTGGEVLVADFGIAAETGMSTDGGDDEAALPAAQVSSVAGTPAYMAPEQARGDAIDARADQFSFCISLWEGLHGERPSQAETRRSGHGADNVPEVPAERRGAPAWLLAAVARGFSPARERRWPSMKALLEYLERRLRRPRLLAFVFGGAALLALAAALMVWLPRDRAAGPDPCPDPAARVDEIWGPAARARVEAAFTASGSPLAADTLERILPALDRYAADWRKAHVASCTATHVAHTQSPELLDKRSVCLDRRLAALRGWAEALAAADQAMVQKAITVPSQLPRIDDCESSEALLAQQPLPADPAARARIAALDARIDELEAELVRGSPVEVAAKAKQVLEETRATEYLPLQVSALYLHVRALGVSRADLEPAARELAAVAARAKDDVMVGYAWGRLIQELVQKGRMDEARQLTPVAENAVERAGGNSNVAFQLHMTLGGFAGNTGDLEGATRHFEKALALAGTRRDQRSGALRNLAYSLWVRGQVKQAQPLITEAVALARELYGPNHPRYADVIDYEGAIFSNGTPDEIDRAVASVSDSMRIRIATFGENHPAVAENLSTLALHAFNRGKLDEAAAYIDRCLAILEKVPAPLTLPNSLTTKAEIVFKQEGIAAATPWYERALAAARAASGERSIESTAAEIAFAERLASEGKCARARELANHALEMLEESKSPTRVGALLQLARCDRREGKPDAAIAKFERALAICEVAECEKMGEVTAIRELGRALVETGRDRTRGYALVNDALARLRAMGPAYADDVVHSEEWLKAHPPP